MCLNDLLIWSLSQENADIGEAYAKARGTEAALIQRLQQENRELQLRVGVLIRLLIERGVFKADDYAALVKEAQAILVESHPAGSSKAPKGNPQ